jgi:hypothetical protein
MAEERIERMGNRDRFFTAGKPLGDEVVAGDRSPDRREVRANWVRRIASEYSGRLALHLCERTGWVATCIVSLSRKTCIQRG